MKKLLSVLALIIAGSIMVCLAAEPAAPAKAPAATKQVMPCYVCTMCKTMAMEPGKCPNCGMDMAAMHMLNVKDGMAYCCSCAADCKCTMKEGADTKKCSCGKDVAPVSLKGKYVCGCGPDCKCNTVSDKPGKCQCGEDMKKVK